LRVRLHIHWVPGHSKVVGNDTSDQLAKHGSQLPTTPSNCTITYAHLRRQIRQQAKEDWERSWTQRQTALKYAGGPRLKLDEGLANASKKDSARAIQVRTGHGYFNAYLAQIRTSSVLTPHCFCGNARQTPEHLILYCTFFKQARRVHLGDLIVRDATGSCWMNIYCKKGTQGLLSFLIHTSIARRPQARQEWSSGMGRL
jgi:hypothetical protein